MALTKVSSGVRDLGTGEVVATDLASTLDLSGKTVTLPAASVTAHASDTDLGPVRNDIATLALHSAIADNKAAYNLSNAFIDQYEDATGVATATTAERSASGEYYTPIIPPTLQTTMALDSACVNTTITSTAGTNQMAIHSGTGEYTFAVLKKDFDLGGNDVKVRFYYLDSSGGVTTTTYPAMTVVMSTGTVATYVDVDNDNAPSGGSGGFGRINATTGTDPSARDQVMEDSTVSTGLGVTAYSNQSSNSVASGSSQILSYYNSSGSATVYGVEFFYDASADTFLITLGQTGVNTSTGAFDSILADHRLTVTGLPSTGKFYLLAGGAAHASNVRLGINPNSVTPDNGISGTVNATGNYTSTTQTALASVSTMGIVVLYKDNAGTASLNGDLVAQVSANGGTNYANATLVAGGTFSTGIKIAAVSGVSVTAGTTPKYKISFANQASGTKETQVHGVALLY